MTADAFVQSIITTVVEDGCADYERLFSNTRLKEASDPYWRTAQALFDSLPEHQRAVFFAVIRQTTVDTISHIFGIIDGSSYLSPHREEFYLTTSAGKRLTDLQDRFLEHFEL